MYHGPVRNALLALEGMQALYAVIFAAPMRAGMLLLALALLEALATWIAGEMLIFATARAAERSTSSIGKANARRAEA